MSGWIIDCVCTGRSAKRLNIVAWKRRSEANGDAAGLSDGTFVQSKIRDAELGGRVRKGVEVDSSSLSGSVEGHEELIRDALRVGGDDDFRERLLEERATSVGIGRAKGRHLQLETERGRRADRGNPPQLVGRQIACIVLTTPVWKRGSGDSTESAERERERRAKQPPEDHRSKYFCGSRFASL